MWEYRAPNIQCFVAPVKPRARQTLQSASSTTPQSGEVFVGKQPNEQHHESPTNTSFSETPKIDDEISLGIASPKEPVFYPETIPEEASSIEEEHVLLFRLPQENDQDKMYYTADASLLHHSHFQASRRSSKTSVQSKDRIFDKHVTKFDFDKIEAFEKKHDDKPKGSSSTERESIDTSPQYQKGDQKSFGRNR